MDDNDLFMAEAASTLAMAVISSWTVSYGAQRALTTRAQLRASGETVDPINESSAMLLPVISSGTLLVLYFLFTYIQNFLVLYMCVASFGATSLVLYEPLRGLQQWLQQRLRLPRALEACLCDVRGAGTTASLVAASVVATWLLTSHWLALDVLGVCVTISVIALVRLPSLKVAMIALIALFVYDIFWVFFSSSFFADNVMVAVATKKADNPAQVFGEHFDLPALRDHASKTLHLPIKLLFPAGIRGGVQTYHMLGLGDMAIPGIFLALALAFDKHLVNERARKDGGEEKSSSSSDDKGHGDLALASSSGVLHGGVSCNSIASSGSSTGEASTACDYLAVEAAAHGPLPAPAQRQYFYAARRGYMCGIALSIGASRLTGAAQPALLYLVPCVLVPIIARAKARNRLGLLWAGFPDDDDVDDENGDDEAPDTKEGADDGISDLVKGEGVEHDEEAQVTGTSSDDSAPKSNLSEIHTRYGILKL